jgi:hypothetical protein
VADNETTEHSSDEQDPVAEEQTGESTSKSGETQAAGDTDEDQTEGEGGTEDEGVENKDLQDMIKSYKLDGLDSEEALRKIAPHFWESKRSGKATAEERDQLRSELEQANRFIELLESRVGKKDAVEEEKPIEVKIDTVPELQRLQTRADKCEARQQACLKEMTSIIQVAEGYKAEIYEARAALKLAGDEVEKAQRKDQLDRIVERYNAQVARYDMVSERNDEIADQLEELKFQITQGKQYVANQLKQRQEQERAQRDAEKSAIAEASRTFESAVKTSAQQHGIPPEKSAKFARQVKAIVSLELREKLQREGDNADGLDMAEAVKAAAAEVATEWTMGKEPKKEGLRPHVEPSKPRVTTMLPKIPPKSNKPFRTQADYEADAAKVRERARRVLGD